MTKKQNNNLNWDQFRSLGNPENAPEEKLSGEEKSMKHFLSKSSIRVHIEKKGRGGKSVSIIRGIDMTNAMMKDLEKAIKSHCGVGGTQKNGEIIIQGDQRDKIIAFLKDRGASDVKKSGG